MVVVARQIPADDADLARVEGVHGAPEPGRVDDVRLRAVVRSLDPGGAHASCRQAAPQARSAWRRRRCRRRRSTCRSPWNTSAAAVARAGAALPGVDSTKAMPAVSAATRMARSARRTAIGAYGACVMDPWAGTRRRRAVRGLDDAPAKAGPTPGRMDVRCRRKRASASNCRDGASRRMPPMGGPSMDGLKPCPRSVQGCLGLRRATKSGRNSPRSGPTGAQRGYFPFYSDFTLEKPAGWIFLKDAQGRQGPVSVRDEVLSANEEYCNEFGDRAELALPPARRFAITPSPAWTPGWTLPGTQA